MKILYVTTVGMTMRFFEPLIRELLNIGNTVDIACNEAISNIPDCYRQWGCNSFPISWDRSPFNSGNINAIKQIRDIVNEGHYDIVHCHTPIAAACTRIACRQARKKGLKVIYTAHGFHFYKGAPLKNWLIYYSVEMLCSRWTDVLITINREDNVLAKKKMYAKRTYYVPGVGIDIGKFANTIVDRDKKRAEIGIPSDAFLLLSVGELNENKNHEIAMRALAQINNRNIHYAIAGSGELKGYLEGLASKLDIAKQVHLLGFRSDIAQLYKIADVFVHPSFREGLPVSVMEAMSSGLPCIVSNIRGNNDLIHDDARGKSLICPTNVNGFATSIEQLAINSELCERMGMVNLKNVGLYDIGNVIKEILALYEDVSSLCVSKSGSNYYGK